MILHKTITELLTSYTSNWSTNHIGEGEAGAIVHAVPPKFIMERDAR